jgi:hypothetical protein
LTEGVVVFLFVPFVEAGLSSETICFAARGAVFFGALLAGTAFFALAAALGTGFRARDLADPLAAFFPTFRVDFFDGVRSDLVGTVTDFLPAELRAFFAAFLTVFCGAFLPPFLPAFLLFLRWTDFPARVATTKSFAAIKIEASA